MVTSSSLDSMSCADTISSFPFSFLFPCLPLSISHHLLPIYPVQIDKIPPGERAAAKSRVLGQLMELEVAVEEYGGKYFVGIFKVILASIELSVG